MWAIFISDIYHPYMYIHGKFYILFANTVSTPYNQRGDDTISFLGLGFYGDHDFEGSRAPKAHLDTVKYKPTAPPPP